MPYFTNLWKWGINAYDPIDSVRCPFCNGGFEQSLSSLSIFCPKCRLMFELDTLREVAHTGALRLYEDWPRDKQMMPKDLLADLETGDRTNDHLVPAEAPAATSLDPTMAEVVETMRRAQQLESYRASQMFANQQAAQQNALAQMQGLQNRNVTVDPGAQTQLRRGFDRSDWWRE